MSKSTWSKSQHSALVDYVATLQAEMRLHHWHLAVHRESAPEPHDASQACTWIAHEAHEARIYVNRRHFEHRRRHQQRQIVVHELCHLILEPVDQAWREIHRPSKDAKAERSLRELVRLATEKANDDFAHRIAEHMPLPPRGWLD